MSVSSSAICRFVAACWCCEGWACCDLCWPRRGSFVVLRGTRMAPFRYDTLASKLALPLTRLRHNRLGDLACVKIRGRAPEAAGGPITASDSFRRTCIVSCGSGASTPQASGQKDTSQPKQAQGKLKPLLRKRARLSNRTDARIFFCAARRLYSPTFKRARRIEWPPSSRAAKWSSTTAPSRRINHR